MPERQVFWCYEDDCGATADFAAEYRRENHDPYLTDHPPQNLIVSTCMQHLNDLLNLVCRDWDGHLSLMTTAHYEWCRLGGHEYTSGIGLGS